MGGCLSYFGSPLIKLLAPHKYSDKGQTKLWNRQPWNVPHLFSIKEHLVTVLKFDTLSNSTGAFHSLYHCAFLCLHVPDKLPVCISGREFWIQQKVATSACFYEWFIQKHWFIQGQNTTTVCCSRRRIIVHSTVDSFVNILVGWATTLKGMVNIVSMKVT